MAAVPVVVATNTFWLLIETILPPGTARGLELAPYFGGMFVATVVGQLLGPYAGLRRELEKLESVYRVWFDANNPVAELNKILWSMGSEAESNSFRSVCSRTDGYFEDYLDEGRKRLLTSVSKNLESVPKLFHVPSVTRDDVAEFGLEPPDECLVSLARGLHRTGWGQVELRPTLEWLAYPPVGLAGALVLAAVMVVLLAVIPVSSVVSAVIVQWPLYFVTIAFFMLLSAGRPSGIVKAALPTGLRVGRLEESLSLARDPFERIRLFLDALPLEDQKGLLQATHYALWKAVREYRAHSKVRASRQPRQASDI